MNPRFESYLPQLIAILISLLVFWCSYDWIFFWDTVQFGSKQPRWFLDHGIGNGLLPNHLDSGHPSFFALYLLIFYKVLGIKLWVAHVAMMPWIYLMFYSIIMLAKKLFFLEWYHLFIAFIACPPLLGHLPLVSPDIVILAAFLLGLRGFLDQSNLKTVLAVMIMCSMSMRGAALGCCMMIMQLLWLRKELDWNTCLRIVKLYVPGGLIILIFLGYHYMQLGWIGYHENSPWAPSFGKVVLLGLVKNCIAFMIRIFDLGMIVIYAVLAWIYFKKGWSNTVKPFLLLWLCFVIVLAILTIPYVGLMNPRYFLPLHVLAILIYMIQVMNTQNLSRRPRVFWMTIILLASFNFFKYPSQISHPWDISVLHWEYYSQEKNMRSYLDTQRIALRDVSTFFPSNNSQYHIRLANHQSSMRTEPGANVPYLMLGDVHNDAKENYRDLVKKDYELIHRETGCFTSLSLYKRK